MLIEVHGEHVCHTILALAYPLFHINLHLINLNLMYEAAVYCHTLLFAPHVVCIEKQYKSKAHQAAVRLVRCVSDRTSKVHNNRSTMPNTLGIYQVAYMQLLFC